MFCIIDFRTTLIFFVYFHAYMTMKIGFSQEIANYFVFILFGYFQSSKCTLPHKCSYINWKNGVTG